MASMLDSLISQLGQVNIEGISKKIGIPKDTAKSAVPAALSVLTNALAKNSTDKKEAKSLTTALSKDHDGSILDNIPDYIKDYQKGSGKGILKHVLGSKQSTVQKGLSKSTGIDKKAMGDLLVMLAPVVMGAIGKVKKKKDLDPDGVRNYLQKEQKQIQKKAPKSAGFLSSLLDSNQDGKIMDDIGKKGMDLLGDFLKK